jgi:hypothetical protein
LAVVVGAGCVVVPSADAAEESVLAAGSDPESVEAGDAAGMGASCADDKATPSALITQKAIERTKGRLFFK